VSGEKVHPRDGLPPTPRGQDPVDLLITVIDQVGLLPGKNIIGKQKNRIIVERDLEEERRPHLEKSLPGQGGVLKKGSNRQRGGGGSSSRIENGGTTRGYLLLGGKKKKQGRNGHRVGSSGLGKC